MSQPYYIDEDEYHCPQCDKEWYPDCPKDPWWSEAYCEHCGYGEGENIYSNEKYVIRERDKWDDT